MDTHWLRSIAVTAAMAVGACASLAPRGSRASMEAQRTDVIVRAQVWRPTDIRTTDLEAGPPGSGAFAPAASVLCDYVDKELPGESPKFACRITPGDEVKVKYGGNNGEVYGEVLATRLLWALGFGADRMYPVRVICRGCPARLGGIARPGSESRFDPAVIERRMTDAEWPPKGRQGWSWSELDHIDPEAGGAPQAHRDALKLLAVFLQHTDSKRGQQRILCLGEGVASPGLPCAKPFLMISDVGLTFGRANRTNANDTSSVNLAAWRQTSIWKDDHGCVGNLPKSFRGTLGNPVISESGRRFLAGLLTQLSDRQLHDLFEVARVNVRLRSPGQAFSGFSSVDEWVDAFKEKRQEIVDRRCA